METTNEGQKITLNSADELESADWTNPIALFLNDGITYIGFVTEISEHEYFGKVIYMKSRPSVNLKFRIPFSRLVGWYSCQNPLNP